MKWHFKKFNELTTEKLYEMISLRIRVFIIEQSCSYDECDEKDLDAIHLFATDKDKITAYARILPPGVSCIEASIGRILVDKEHRGKGLARQIVNKAIEYIKTDLRETSIRIQAQQYLEKFYAELGFKTVSSTFILENIPHVDMLLTNSANKQ